jgi:hypothetical protein
VRRWSFGSFGASGSVRRLFNDVIFFGAASVCRGSVQRLLLVASALLAAEVLYYRLAVGVLVESLLTTHPA